MNATEEKAMEAARGAELSATPCSAVKVGDVVICWIDEWNEGNKDSYDAHVISKRSDGVVVCYLSGYRSRNDFVPWADVVAKLDRRRKVVSVADGTFRGHFQVFPQNDQVEARRQ